MKVLGATPFYYRAEADEAVGLEQTVEPWLEGLPEALEDVKKTINKMNPEEKQERLQECKLLEQ